MNTEHSASPARLAVKGILFDLDGTLVDSAPDIGNAANATLVALGFEAVSKERVAGWIGNGIPKLVKRALTGDFDGEPDAELFDRALPIFMDYYQHHVCVDSRMYDGVAETLTHLSEAGFILGCVTNKAGSCTLPLLDQLGISHYFASIIAGDSCSKKKPDPEPLLCALEEMSIKPAEALLVGDSAHDIHAAQAAAMPVIAVSYGYNQGTDLGTLNPLAEVDQFADIQKWFELA